MAGQNGCGFLCGLAQQTATGSILTIFSEKAERLVYKRPTPRHLRSPLGGSPWRDRLAWPLWRDRLFANRGAARRRAALYAFLVQLFSCQQWHSPGQFNCRIISTSGCIVISEWNVSVTGLALFLIASKKEAAVYFWWENCHEGFQYGFSLTPAQGISFKEISFNYNLNILCTRSCPSCAILHVCYHVGGKQVLAAKYQNRFVSTVFEALTFKFFSFFLCTLEVKGYARKMVWYAFLKPLF